MGNPLSICWEGNNVAFAAGTGVLVFLDFAAFILRSVCLKQDKIWSDNFHFTLHAAFEDQQEAIGLDILEALAGIAPEVFTLKTRFRGQARWDHDYVKNGIATEQRANGPEKVWVCGTPEMTVMFREIFKDLGRSDLLNESAVTVL